jgi:hypothetical protein
LGSANAVPAALSSTPQHGGKVPGDCQLVRPRLVADECGCFVGGVRHIRILDFDHREAFFSRQIVERADEGLFIHAIL